MAIQLAKAQVGRTPLRVTRLGLGAAPLSYAPGAQGEEQALQAVQAAWEQGIRFIDMAPMYGYGEAERRVGAALRHLPRQDFVLETKVRRPSRAWAEHEQPPRDIFITDYGREAILRGISSSLERLGVDRVDIVLVHDPDLFYQDALDQAFPTLTDLRDQGVIGAIGAGMNQWQMEDKFLQYADPDCFLLASRYTLLEQGALGFLGRCQQRQVSVFLGGVFNTGILATGAVPGARYSYREPPPEILEKVGRIEAICQQHATPLAAAALQFAAAHPAVAALVLGMATAQEVAQDLEMWEWPIPPALWEDLRRAGLLDPAAPLP